MHESAGHDVSAPAAGGTLPTGGMESIPKQEQTLTRHTTGMTAQQPALSASMNAMAPMAAALASTAATTAACRHDRPQRRAAHAASMPAAMTAAAPAATVLPSMTLQPNVAPMMEKTFEKSLNEKPVPEKTVDRILSDKQPEKPERTQNTPALNLQSEPGDAAVSFGSLGRRRASTSRTNLRVVPNPVAPHPPVQTATPPLAASLPTAAKIVDMPMQPVTLPPPLSAKIADAPMQPPPTAPVVTVHVTPPAAPVMPASVPTPRHEEHNFRVLAVDDSPLMRTFLRNKLEPYGIAPEFASSGEEALFKISKQHFDLIFLDVMLPGMDGYDVCKMIKKNKDNNLMKVVMLTSKDKTFDKIRGTMAGCDGYLTKPVDEMKLRAIIERHSVTKK